MGNQPARFYQEMDKGMVQCQLCSHFCLIKPGDYGQCRGRQNIDGQLVSLVYGYPVAINIDPIEKKPFYHFLPGSQAFSLGTWGCNFHCYNCLNYEISQAGPMHLQQSMIQSSEIVEQALTTKCEVIAYTYNEPTIFTEYALEIMKLAHQQGLKNVWVSNGFMSPQCRQAIVPYLDAINIDFKSSQDSFYQEVCGGRLAPVLDNLVYFKEQGIHVEITSLIIPTLSDQVDDFKKMAQWIKQELGPLTPWHLSAFSPEISWRLTDLPATSLTMLRQRQLLAQELGLQRVYLGNVIYEESK